MDLASVVAALASVGVRVSGSTPNSSVQVDSSRACPTGLAGPEPSGTINNPGQHFHIFGQKMALFWVGRPRNTCLPASIPCNQFFFESSTCKIGLGGLELTSQAPKTVFWAHYWHFSAIFGKKMPIFLVGRP